MGRIFRAYLRRLSRTPSFYVTFAACLAYAALSALLLDFTAKLDAEAGYLVGNASLFFLSPAGLVCLVFVAFLSSFFGTDFRSKAMLLYLESGAGRKSIYFSGLLLALGMATLYFSASFAVSNATLAVVSGGAYTSSGAMFAASFFLYYLGFAGLSLLAFAYCFAYKKGISGFAFVLLLLVFFYVLQFTIAVIAAAGGSFDQFPVSFSPTYMWGSVLPAGFQFGDCCGLYCGVNSGIVLALLLLSLGLSFARFRKADLS